MLTRRRFLLRASLGGAALWQIGCGGGGGQTSRTAVPPPGGLPGWVDRFGRALVSQGMAVGVAAAAYDQARTLAAGYGRRIEGGELVDERTLFEIGSVTKAFTATLLGEAVEAGSLSLAMPIGGLLPAGTHLRPEVAGRITLQMLVTHTSGLPRIAPNERRGRDGNVVGYTVADLVAFLNRFRPRYALGTHYAYSNIGFGLLGLILGRAAGTDWPVLIAREITGPLKLGDTVVTSSGGQVARTAAGYRQGQPVAPLVTPSFLGGGGALRSTAADMLAFLRAEIEAGNEPSSLTRGIAVTQRGYFPLPGGRSQGLAWTLAPLTAGGVGLSKNGGTEGFSAIISFEPTLGRGVFIVANRRRLSGTIDPAAHRALGFRTAPADVTDTTP